MYEPVQDSIGQSRIIHGAPCQASTGNWLVTTLKRHWLRSLHDFQEVAAFVKHERRDAQVDKQKQRSTLGYAGGKDAFSI